MRHGSVAGSGEAVSFLIFFSGEAVLLFVDLFPLQICYLLPTSSCFQQLLHPSCSPEVKSLFFPFRWYTIHCFARIYELFVGTCSCDDIS
jgi:hypothetical protein